MGKTIIVNGGGGRGFNGYGTDAIDHPRLHDILSTSDHFISGTTLASGQVLKLTGTTSTDFTFITLNHSELAGISANQHHNEVTIATTGLSAKLTMATGQVLSLAAIDHGDLSNITANQHHNEITIGTTGLSTKLSIAAGQILSLAQLTIRDISPVVATNNVPQNSGSYFDTSAIFADSTKMSVGFGALAASSEKIAVNGRILLCGTTILAGDYLLISNLCKIDSFTNTSDPKPLLINSNSAGQVLIGTTASTYKMCVYGAGTSILRVASSDDNTTLRIGASASGKHPIIYTTGNVDTSNRIHENQIYRNDGTTDTLVCTWITERDANYGTTAYKHYLNMVGVTNWDIGVDGAGRWRVGMPNETAITCDSGAIAEYVGGAGWAAYVYAGADANVGAKVRLHTKPDYITGTTAIVAGANIGAIEMFGSDGVNHQILAGQILCIATSTVALNRVPGIMIFSTHPDSVGTTVTEAMRINQAQQLLIGTTTAVEKVTITGGLKTTLDIYQEAYTDYTATSTVTGWSASGLAKQICYKKIGRRVFVDWNITGTSNSATTRFTLPVSCTSKNSGGIGQMKATSAKDNGVVVAATALLAANAVTINFEKVAFSGGGDWTTSGTKTVRGTMHYEAES